MYLFWSLPTVVLQNTVMAISLYAHYKEFANDHYSRKHVQTRFNV